ncbi:MAG: ABC transporter ATP-binding protein [Candidatus Eremiobacteraeota bacterium]|nr:ABC transporter ATP-binding protein [Candidatus Eremiobacteraeota bacterium]
MSSLLRARGLGVRYGRRSIFEDVGVEINGGELVALIGPNGAGKSSLLRVLAGTQKPSNGVVERPAAAALVATSVALPPDVTPAQLSGYVLALRRPWWQVRRTSAERASITAALERTGLRERADDAAATLSSGEVQRAWIAAALATDAGTLLIDEPTTHLDVRYQLEILRTLKTIARSGIAVVAAIHDLTLAARFADRIALLAGGILSCGPPAGILQPDALTKAFGISVATHIDDEGFVVCTPR